MVGYRCDNMTAFVLNQYKTSIFNALIILVWYQDRQPTFTALTLLVRLGRLQYPVCKKLAVIILKDFVRLPASSWINFGQELVSWSLTSLFSTNMAISETRLRAGNTGKHETESSSSRCRQLSVFPLEYSFIVAALWNRAGRYIFILWFLRSYFLFSFFPRTIIVIIIMALWVNLTMLM